MANRGEIKHTSVYLPKEIHTSLRIASLNTGLTMSDLVVQSLQGTWSLAVQRSCPEADRQERQE